jgi:threonyl-tRNA synthetase
MSDDKVGAKIARAHADKIPYMLVVGPKEAEAGVVNVRVRQRKDTKTISLGEFTSIIQGKIADKSLDLMFFK